MKIFISYSSHDDVAVRSLAADLQRARQQVWLDQDLGGGDAWWAEILEQIRACSVFVFALSNSSLYSTPCHTELDYAKALSLPILPVQIGEMSSFRTDPIFSMQLVDYRDATKNSVIDLVSALHECATRRVELPDPLPEPPPIPYEYLQRLGAAIRGSTPLSPEAQAAMSLELRIALQDEPDQSVRDDIRQLLVALRGRRDVTYAIVREIDSILDKDAADLSQTAVGSGAAEMTALDPAHTSDLAASDVHQCDQSEEVSETTLGPAHSITESPAVPTPLPTIPKQVESPPPPDASISSPSRQRSPEQAALTGQTSPRVLKSPGGVAWASRIILALEILLSLVSLLYLVLFTGFAVRDTIHPGHHRLVLGDATYLVVVAWWAVMLALLIDVFRRFRGRIALRAPLAVWLTVLAVVVVGSAVITMTVAP